RPYYKARVEVTATDLRDVPRSFRLIPGMAVTAEIKAGERTILSYFLYPLLRGLDESIREPSGRSSRVHIRSQPRRLGSPIVTSRRVAQSRGATWATQGCRPRRSRPSMPGRARQSQGA